MASTDIPGKDVKEKRMSHKMFILERVNRRLQSQAYCRGLADIHKCSGKVKWRLEEEGNDTHYYLCGECLIGNIEALVNISEDK
jgi:hypothetical protein